MYQVKPREPNKPTDSWVQPTLTGLGIAAGATLGTIFAPGFGTAAGAEMGAMLGGAAGGAVTGGGLGSLAGSLYGATKARPSAPGPTANYAPQPSAMERRQYLAQNDTDPIATLQSAKTALNDLPQDYADHYGPALDEALTRAQMRQGGIV